MKKITILLFAMIMSIGASAQVDELLFDGSATPDGQQFFRQGPSFNPFGSNVGATDDGTGNMVLEVERTTNGGATWQVLPLLDAAGQGVARSIGDGGTFPALQVSVRTNRNGNSTISARIQDGTVRATDVVITGGDGTNFGAWQTIILDCRTFAAANKRPEFYVDPAGSATTPPAANYLIQFDDIWAITAATLGTSDFKDLSSFISNPVRSSIDLDGSGNYSIYSLSGAVVQSGSFKTSINVESLKTGFYILATDNGRGKFIKE